MFQDYEKHLAEVEKLNPDKNQAGGESVSDKPVVDDSKEGNGNDEKSSPVMEQSVKPAKSTEGVLLKFVMLNDLLKSVHTDK